MPTSRASTKPLRLSPPAIKSATNTRTTVKLVMIDRAAVCMIERLATCSKVSERDTIMFSRIRSNTTIVSWTEKPTTVRTAVMKSVSISPMRRPKPLPRIEKMPPSTATSCRSASRAEPPN